MVLRPAYIDDLAAAILNGRATRPAVEIERLLAVCRGNGCGRWTPAGCRRDFAALLADAERTCAWWQGPFRAE